MGSGLPFGPLRASWNGFGVHRKRFPLSAVGFLGLNHRANAVHHAGAALIGPKETVPAGEAEAVGIFSMRVPIRQEPARLDKSSNRGLFRVIGGNNFQNVGLFYWLPVQVARCGPVAHKGPYNQIRKF
jgi:hypothetical protein